MRDRLKHYPVNWIDGMKINKQHFLDQDNALFNALHDNATLFLSPQRYGVLPPSVAGESTFKIKISLDNQSTLHVAVDACQAITPGGVRIALPAFSSPVPTAADAQPTTILPFSAKEGELDWWIVLVANPYERQPAGSPHSGENPERLPYMLPVYSIQVVSDNQYRQYAYHPYALTIGKLFVYNGEIRIIDYYIPPCVSVNAHPDLLALHNEFDTFLSAMERNCAAIVQKIFRKSQQNELSELVMFVCDRIMLYLGQVLTAMRFSQIHEPPVRLFLNIATLARVIKNSIDLRSGSGKDELMNYLSEWCDLKQGELESLLNSIANMNYEHNDVNKNIGEVSVFVKVIGKLFSTLSKLEFIGKRKESGIFVKEEPVGSANGEMARKDARRRFFG